jgi:hypothetical protein
LKITIPMFFYVFFLIDMFLNLHFHFCFLFFDNLKILYEHYFFNNMYMSMDNVLCVWHYMTYRWWEWVPTNTKSQCQVGNVKRITKRWGLIKCLQNSCSNFTQHEAYMFMRSNYLYLLLTSIVEWTMLQVSELMEDLLLNVKKEDRKHGQRWASLLMDSLWALG